MGDVEDPEIYCAEPIYQWQQTPAGKWCMEKPQIQPTILWPILQHLVIVLQLQDI